MKTRSAREFNKLRFSPLGAMIAIGAFTLSSCSIIGGGPENTTLPAAQSSTYSTVTALVDRLNEAGLDCLVAYGSENKDVGVMDALKEDFGSSVSEISEIGFCNPSTIIIGADNPSNVWDEGSKMKAEELGKSAVCITGSTINSNDWFIQSDNEEEMIEIGKALEMDVTTEECEGIDGSD